MRLVDLLGVIEMSQDVGVYKVGEDDCVYEGMAAHVPEALLGMKVECLQAYEYVIDVLASQVEAE